MKLQLLKATALALLQVIAVQSADADVSEKSIKEVAANAATKLLTPTSNIFVNDSRLNDCLDDCDKDGHTGKASRECRNDCEMEYGRKRPDGRPNRTPARRPNREPTRKPTNRRPTRPPTRKPTRKPSPPTRPPTNRRPTRPPTRKPNRKPTNSQSSCTYFRVNDDTCRGKNFCHIKVGKCNSRVGQQDGKCKEIPEVCTREQDPVCGCDGKSYSNECAAYANGVNVRNNGSCR